MIPSNWRFSPSFVVKYYCYQATTTYGFFWPVFTIFLRSRGLSFAQIGLLGSLSAATVVVGELPTGYLADRIGRRNGLLFGSGLLASSVLGFLVAQTFISFAVLWVLWGLGVAFQSGSADAWLYDALSMRGHQDEYTRIRGRGGAINQWVSAGTMLCAGVLYGIGPFVPFAVGGLLLCVSMVVLVSMSTVGSSSESSDTTFTPFDAMAVIRSQLRTPPLRSFVLYLGLFFAIISSADIFIQPITVRSLGFPHAWLGPLYAGFTAIAAIGSYGAAELESAFSTRTMVVLVPVVVSVWFVLPVLAPFGALGLFFVMKSSRSVLQPIASGYINTHTESVGRATILSAVSMVYALVRLPLKPLGGVVADLTSPIGALGALGLFFLCAGGLVSLWESPVTRSASRSEGTPK
ncbi:MFS transporter [Halocatena halophila]|uniref:MFS transporter n=1 Tax=Halocatena halophila TaxID=2814576 RepID=UPI002ED09CE7